MFNIVFNDIQISPKNFSCFYGTNCNNPFHQNNNEKYNESNPQFYKNYINNNINNLNLIKNNQFFNFKINTGAAMRILIEQKYEDDPFKQRIHYLRNNNININNEFIITKNNILNSLKNNFNSNTNQKNIIYNSRYNNYESERLNDEKITPNQILFYKNIESLKNIYSEK